MVHRQSTPVSNTAGTITLKVDDTTVGTGSLNATSDVEGSSTVVTTGTTLTITVTDIAKGVKVYGISYTYTSDTNVCSVPTFSPEGGTYTEAQSVTLACATEEATIYYTTDGTDPTAESTKYTGAITVSETTTIKAMAVKADYTNSSIASATYTIVSIEHAGTEADPYTVADAIAAIDAGTGVTEVYATGIVSEIVTAYNSEYGNISYNISDDGTTTSAQLQAYRGKGIDGASFTSETDIQVGDVVVITGDLTKYNETYEFAADNQLVSLKRSAEPSIVPAKTTVEVEAAENEGTITVAYNNIETIKAGVKFYEADGTTETTYDWFEAGIDPDADNCIYYLVDENTATEARSAYLKVYNGDVYSDLITITQAGYKADYATLPLLYDGGKADLPTGFTASGLGSDYKSSPYLKFDGTGDYLILKLNEAAAVMSFDIKGNSFSGGTFTVQTSADGQTYTDLAAYTELDATQTEVFTLADDVRYIKWIYTDKSAGNVAVGNFAVGGTTITVPAAGYATFVSEKVINLTGSAVAAYIATADGTDAVNFKQITKVPANTGVLLYAEGGATATVPYASEGDATDDNLFVAGEGAAVASTDGDYANYILNNGSNGMGFYKAAGQTVATDKAYIHIPTAVSVKGFIALPGADQTSVKAIETASQQPRAIYNLAGQRVQKATRGIYVVNGKKVIF